MAVPKIIHQTSKSLAPAEARLCQRLRSKLPGWEYRMWTDEDNEALVRKHFPQYVDSYCAIRRGVVKADIARYMYMAVFGGFYFDTDYKMFRNIDDSLLNHPCILPVSRMNKALFRLGNAVFGSEPGYIFWSDFLEHIFSQCGEEESIATLAENRIEKVTGPEGLTDFYLARKAKYPEIYLPPRPLFHPDTSWRGLLINKSESTFGAHLCWGGWRSKGMIHRAVDALGRQISSMT